LVKSNENDYRDGEAIAEAVQRPWTRFVLINMKDQLDSRSRHSVRDRLVSHRTRLVNQIRDELERRGTSLCGRTAFSPVSSRIVFVSTESGQPEVNVEGIPTLSQHHMVGERRQISRDGAWPVRWSADCGELVYLGVDSVFYAVPFEGPLEFGDRKSLFRASLALRQRSTTSDFQFDVSPDGQRFILATTGSVHRRRLRLSRTGTTNPSPETRALR
jgi:dipeptidyl aminopeptidase/acylaminoacyl peptidase